MSEQPILTRKEGGVAVITLNRPESFNSISRSMLAALYDAVMELRFDEEIRTVIFTAAGDKAFCSGADLKERSTMTMPEVRKYIHTIRSLFALIEDMPMPTIAAVNGIALGGGTELALSCDLRIVADTAKMGLTETSLAIIPGAGGTQRLPRIVGMARAKELIFTAERIDAARAQEIGLANRVVPIAGLMDASLEMAAKIAANGPVAIRMAKRSIDKGMQMDLASAMAFETTCYDVLIPTEDRLEGLQAFKEKRKPMYKGK